MKKIKISDKIKRIIEKVNCQLSPRKGDRLTLSIGLDGDDFTATIERWSSYDVYEDTVISTEAAKNLFNLLNIIEEDIQYIEEESNKAKDIIEVNGVKYKRVD